MLIKIALINILHPSNNIHKNQLPILLLNKFLEEVISKKEVGFMNNTIFLPHLKKHTRKLLSNKAMFNLKEFLNNIRLMLIQGCNLRNINHILLKDSQSKHL